MTKQVAHPSRKILANRRAVVAGGASAVAALMSSALPGYAQPAPAGEETLKIGMANSVMTVTYPYITNAQQLGFFKQEGVKADVVMGQGSPQILSLLVAGTAELVFCNPEPVAQLNADRNLPVKAIFTVLHSQYILSVPEDSPIQKVEDLRGKRVGMFSPQSGIDYLKARLQDAGMTVDDITIVPTAFGGQTMVAVRQKQVDAIMYWSDANTMMRYAGLKLRDLPKADWEKGLYQYVATTTQDVLNRKPEALRRALRAMAQGQMASVTSPEQTIEAFWRQYPDQAPKPDARDKAFEQNLVRVNDQNKLLGLPPNWTREQLMTHQWGIMTLEAWTRTQDNLFRVGSLKAKVDPNRFFDNQFITYANGFDRAKIFALGAAK